MLLLSTLVGSSIAHAAAPAGVAASGQVAASATCDSVGTPTTIVYLPNITKTLGGASGWDTPFYIQNAGVIQTTIEVSFFRFSDGALVACRKTVAVAPGATLLDDPNADADLPNDSQFSSVVKSFGAPVVATVNQLQGTGPTTEGLSYSGFFAGATKVYLPNVTRRFYGYDVPFIIQNLGTAQTVVNAAFVSFDGTQTFQTSLSVAPGRSGVIDPDFTPGLVDGTQYAVTLTATQPVAVVVNAHNELIGPVAFSHNGLATGGTTLYAPYAAKISNGMFSPVVVQNVGAATTDATLTFSPLGVAGGTPQAFTLTAIPAGASRAFDPRFAIGTTTPCSIAAPACLGPGEFSLKIQSTVPVAAVVLPNSSSTAAGYLATADLQSRTLLPVVMRTAGGANGWTTLVYVQSGTATQATVRYYGLTTGALVTSQPLTFTGGSAKIDPRLVPALQDNGQYAVTIDGNGGTLTAIAHEQALSGGDASMIYEGFALPSLPAGLQAGSLTVRSGSATVTGNLSQQFTAAVNDQFGSPFAGAALIWTVLPVTLGAVSLTGLFTAGAATGSGVVTVTTSGMTASASVSVQAATTATIGGITFRLTVTGSADAYIDATITAADEKMIVAGIDGDVAKVETEFGRSFATRPSIYVFGTVQNATAGNQSIFKMTATGAAQFAQITGFFDTLSSTSVAVNWYIVKVALPITITRHELTHMMVHQIAGQFTAIPAWINEGNAVLVDSTVPGAGWEANTNRYVAVSAAAAAPSKLIPLADLVSQAQWNARISPAAYFQYYEASQAAQFVRTDVGVAGTIRILELIGQGQTFDAAFQTVTGGSLATFSAGFPARLKASVATYPGVVTSTDTPYGRGIHFVAYGFSPSTTLTYTWAGPSGGSFTGTTNEYGAFSRAITTSFNWQPGTYTITVVETATKLASATATLAAPATASGFRVDAGADRSPLRDREDPPRPAE